ncbi:tellurite resistance TerB family protein [Azospirillum soli]|uniref:tellurite resistance TerB family protein n=1 Tax=Azospirillum soli TaxID=1304799 RepID=UPI001AE63D22|nr:tellurite resistance TerB family protein [Azospirillum soli]MBP2313091.1 uncharacterized membrane protein YebE (DUF533 family) [Azospirillum soli]
MADLPKLLGTMLATGLAGRSHRGPGFASAMGASRGGSFKNTAGLAALGYLAYKAYQDRQANQAQQTPPTTRTASGGPSLGERLSSIFSPQAPQPAPGSGFPELAMEDRKALLLIRAMIAAANADGVITPDERRVIVSKMDEAGAGPDEHRVLEQELANPLSMDALLREVRDEETAEQVYMASTIAIEADTPAEQSYLQYLAARLNLPPERIQAMRGIA